MKAVQLVEWEAPAEMREVAVPAVGSGEALIKVTAAGLCRSDLHLMEWPPGTLPYRLPMTLGHENAGVVAALGSGANGVAEGDAVLVYGSWGCERCRHCVRGEMNLCSRLGERGIGAGLGFDGGLAEYMVVPSTRYLLPIGDLDPAQAAPLTDAGLSPYRAIKARLSTLEPDTSAVVIGPGGLGHVAIRLLRVLSPARVVAVVGTRPEGIEAALRMGAHAAFRFDNADTNDIRSELGSAGATLVLDFVGSDDTAGLAAQLLAMGGHATMMGLRGGTFPMRFGAVPMECSAGLSCWGSLPELREVIALARSEQLEIDVETVTLDETLAAYERLRDGRVDGRAVVVPDGERP
jgi:alcohol dehydrogenase, propanol-preferring